MAMRGSVDDVWPCGAGGSLSTPFMATTRVQLRRLGETSACCCCCCVCLSVICIEFVYAISEPRRPPHADLTDMYVLRKSVGLCNNKAINVANTHIELLMAEDIIYMVAEDTVYRERANRLAVT